LCRGGRIKRKCSNAAHRKNKNKAPHSLCPNGPLSFPAVKTQPRKRNRENANRVRLALLKYASVAGQADDVSGHGFNWTLVQSTRPFRQLRIRCAEIRAVAIPSER
jgi:hypothetical protein